LGEQDRVDLNLIVTGRSGRAPAWKMWMKLAPEAVTRIRISAGPGTGDQAEVLRAVQERLLQRAHASGDSHGDRVPSLACGIEADLPAPRKTGEKRK
jgi:hypothetical protein